MDSQIQELQQAVNKLIFENSSYVLSEISLLEADEKLGHLAEEIVKETYCDDYNEESEKSSTTFIVAHSKLLDIIKHRPSGGQFPLFLTAEEREHTKSVFLFVRSFMDWKFNYTEFYKALCSEPYLPLELLWNLHEKGIMPFEMFFTSILDKPKTVTAFSRSIVNLGCMELPLEKAAYTAISGILAYVVANAFPLADNEDNIQETGLNKVSRIIVDCMLKRILTCERPKSEETRILTFNLLFENSTTVQASLHSFCCYTLKFTLSYNPNVRVSQALSEQQNWTFRTENSDFVCFIQKVLMKLKPQEVSSILHQALDSQEVNWKALLIVTSTYLICFKEASSYLLDIISQLLNEAFTKFESDHLFSGFLLVRQATLEGPPLFPFTYGDWFQKTFGDASSTPANSPRTFGFLMKFLTDLVPHEHIQYLKAHVERPPYVVNRCRSIFSEYSSLVKTRLRDLVPDSSSGLFSSGSDSTSSRQSSKAQLAAEVEKVLQSYEATGKISSAVLEASIFRKPYFNGQFLPALLTARLLPDVPDTKMKFIDALKRSGKIPPSLFEQYEKACNKEKEKLFEGITLDDSFEDEFLSPGEQLQEVLKSLERQLKVCTKSSSGSQSLLGALTENCEKLESVLREIIQSNGEISSVIMLSEGIVLPTEKEVIEKLLDSYCHLLHSLKDVDFSVILAWDLVSLLTHFPSLQTVLYYVIWEKLANSQNSHECELSGLALCILRMGVLNCQYPPVIQSNSLPEPVLFPEAVFDNLPVTNGTQIQYFLRLACLYLDHVTHCISSSKDDSASSVLPNYVPVILLKKFQFTAFRLAPQVINYDAYLPHSKALEVAAVKLYNSAAVKQWINVHQLSLKEWLTFESEVLAENDHLDAQKRSDFLRWCLNCYFMTYPDLVSADAQSVYRASASTLFRVLMSTPNSKSSYPQLSMILQELVSSSLSCGPSISCSNPVPWLLQEFDVALRGINQNDVSTDKINLNNQTRIRDVVNKFIRITCSLPPLLLVVDSACEAQINPDFKALENFINNFLRLYSCENGFLSPELTCHLLKAVLEIFQASNNECTTENFLFNCPLLVYSLIIQRKFIQPIISNFKMKNNYLSQLLFEIDGFIRWSESFVSKKNTSAPPAQIVLHEWVPGLILALKLLVNENCTMPFHLLNYQLFMWSVQFLLVLETTHPAVQHHGIHSSSCTSSFVKAFIMIHKNGDGFDPRMYGQSTIKKILSPALWHNFPAVILRTLLATFPKEDVPRMSEDSLLPLLSSLLQNLAECTKNCDASPCSVDENLKDIPKTQNKILTMEFLLDSTQKVKDIVSVLSATTIKALPHILLQHCGEEMQLFLYQKAGKRPRTE